MMHHFNDRSHSGLDSESESIDVYVPSSEYGSPASRRDGLNSNYESIVICNEVDIESELNKARDPTDTDSMFKILSMNFYDKKPCSKEENVFTCPGLTLNSERSHKSTFSNKNSEVTPKPRPSAGSTTLPKQLLHHNFFNVDKIKLMNQALAKLSPSNAPEISPAKHKQSNPNRYSLLINPRPSLKSPTNSVKSPKDIDIHRYTLPSTTKAEKTAQKPRTSLQTKKEVKNKPVNAEPRGSLLAKQQSPKNAWKPPSVNKTIQTLQKELSFRNSTKPVMSESTPKNSVSPRVRVPESKPKGKQMAQKTASLKEQILQTLAKKIPSKKPPAKQSLLVKNELSLSKQVLSNPTKSKRGTIEYMSVSIAKEAEKESTKKTEANGTSGYRPFQRLRTYDDDDNARALALMPPKNLSAKNAANENFKKAQASGFLFHSENVKVNIQDVISKKAALRVLQNLKGKLRGISLTGSNKPKESKGTSDKELYSHQRFYFKSKLNMTANERTKDTDSTNCKDSFVSLQSKTLEI